jgi:hypothetical protein
VVRLEDHHANRDRRRRALLGPFSGPH